MRKLRVRGFTLAELLIGVAISLLVAVVMFLVVMVQISKARDARRKADLEEFKIAVEAYFNDFGRFPDRGNLPGCGQGFDRYLKSFPCEPGTSKPYVYLTDELGTWFKAYTNLERTKDPVIAQIGCETGCGLNNAYNYGVSSSEGRVGSGLAEEGVQPECGGPGKWFCFANICAECCPGSTYRCNGLGTKCILDQSCRN